MMTGAKNFYGSTNALSFSLPGAGGFCKNGINRVNIALEADDTYTVNFYRFRRGSALVRVAQAGNVYAEDLRQIFESETGLATRMGKVVMA